MQMSPSDQKTTNFGGELGGNRAQTRAKKMQNRIPPRIDRLIHERIHDPYKTKSKPPEISVCPVCFAVFKGGRWQWAAFWPIKAHRQTCQACHRIRDNYPAGIITITGSFALSHRTEILNLIRNKEREEKSEHPLHRILQIEEQPSSLVIKTTDIHLPHAMGEALRHAYKGSLAVQYSEETYFIHVRWSRQ
jgi:NMD protein affecting ribosome stability and mRNA decay